MSWNYRVVKNIYPDIPHLDERAFYDVREVYYSVGGTGDSWTVSGISAHGTSIGELKSDINRWLHALARPVLVVKEDEVVGEEDPLLPYRLSLDWEAIREPEIPVPDSPTPVKTGPALGASPQDLPASADD